MMNFYFFECYLLHSSDVRIHATPSKIIMELYRSTAVQAVKMIILKILLIVFYGPLGEHIHYTPISSKSQSKIVLGTNGLSTCRPLINEPTLRILYFTYELNHIHPNLFQ